MALTNQPAGFFGNNPDPSLVNPSAPLSQVSGPLNNAVKLGALNPFNDSLGASTADLITQSASSYTDPFYNWYSNDGTSFNSVFGYQFVITNLGRVVQHFYLPLAPSNISMTVPVATAIAVTMKGITEDNNAAPVRQIVISGETGVWHTSQPQGSSNSTVSNTLDYLFKNTIQAANNVANAVNKTVAAFSGNPQATSGPLNYDNPTDAATINQSGYWSFHNMIRFLDFYITNKKTRAGKDMRFTFQMHKDQMYYDCILTGYNWQKIAGTTEYSYTINLTAYRRRPAPILQDAGSALPQPVTASDLNAFASIINGLRSARNVISASANVLRGIQADADSDLFQPMREAILLGSDALGLVTTIADFPQAIVNSAKASIESALQDITGSANTLRTAVNNLLSSQYKIRSATSSSNTNSQTALNNKLTVQSADGQSQLAVRPETANPVEAIFKDSVYYAPVFDLIPETSLNLPLAVSQAMNNEVDRVRSLTISDWTKRRTNMRNVAVAISAALGGGDATYNKLIGLPPPTPTTKKLSTDDIATLSNINDAIMSIDAIISQLQQAPVDETNDYFAFYGTYAVANGVAFNPSASKYFIPFPHDGSLEMLAQQYLGDYTRWIEIAALNGLRDPYIDEDGFNVPLIADSAEDSVRIADPTNLYIGDVVQVSSNSKVSIPRTIASMQEISANNWLVIFEDGPSVVGYSVSSGASLFAYLPDTVNSTKLIAIPSNQPVNVPGKIQLTPGTEDLTFLGVIAQTDFLLQSDGQLVLSSGGDVQLAQGMTNLVQAASIRLNTPLGSVVQWPTYGNPANAGDSVATVNAQNALSNLSKQFQQDPRFTGILAGRFQIDGPATVMQILLGVSNSQINLPLSTQLPP